MKILEISPLGYEEGGIETGLVLINKLMRKRGHIVRIFTSDKQSNLPRFNHYEYKVPRGLIGKLFYSFNPYAYFALKKVLAEFQPDIVHIHSINYASPSILFALRNYPTVMTIHGPEPFSKSLLLWCFPEGEFKGGKRKLNKLTFVGRLRYFYHRYIEIFLYALGFHNVDVFVTLSGYMNRLIKKEGIENEYVPNGTVLFEYKPVSKESINHNLAYAGRLETYKGVDYLLYAMKTILKSIPDTKLLIAGDGSEKTNLKKLSTELGIENSVKFLGYLSRAEIEHLYQSASIIAVPSIYPEAFGKIGIEAMSVGRPVIATDVGGISDWLHNGENGFLIKPGSSEALAEAVIQLFSNPDKYLNMMKKARLTAEEFDLEKYADNMTNLYQSLLEKY